MFVLEEAAMVRLSSQKPRKPKRGSAYEKVLSYQGIVASYASDDFGYIIRRAADGEYHFVHFEKGEYDRVSAGYSSLREAARAALADSWRQNPRHQTAHWIRELKADSEGSGALVRSYWNGLTGRVSNKTSSRAFIERWK